MRFKWSRPCHWKIRGIVHHMLRITSAHGKAIPLLLILPLQSCHKFKQDDISAPNTSFCCTWHLFPVISLPWLTIVAILLHYMQLSQETMAFLTQSFLNELNTGYFGAPCLRLRLGAIKWELIGIMQNLRGMVWQDVQSQVDCHLTCFVLGQYTQIMNGYIVFLIVSELVYSRTCVGSTAYEFWKYIPPF